MLCLKCLQSVDEQVHYGMHEACFAEWFHVESNAEFVGLQNISTSSSSGRDFTPQNDSFFQGEYHLSPIYDNVSYLSLEKGDWLKADFDARGKIATKATNAPNMSDYVVELIRLGYKEEVQKFYRHVQGMGWTQIIDRINHSACSHLMKAAITKVMTKRLQELENALSA